jgi:uncharacterized protein YjbI with pentapeptide repeats
VKNPSKQIQRFLEQQMIPQYLQKHANLKAFIFQNQQELGQKILTIFDDFFQKINEEQKQGQKKAIGLIYLSALYMAVATGDNLWLMEAYEESVEEEDSYKQKYDMAFYLQSIHAFKDTLQKDSKRYVALEISLEIERFILQYMAQYIFYFIQLTRSHLEEIIQLESFQKMDKSEAFYIGIGEYNDRGEIIYTSKNTYDTTKEAKLHLETAYEKKAIGTVLRGLDISDGTYNEYDLRGSTFEKSSLENITMETSLLNHTCFKEAHLKQVSFAGSIIHDSNFSHGTLEGVDFSCIFSEVRNVEGLEIGTGCTGTRFSKAKLIEVFCRQGTLAGADFREAHLVRCQFVKSDLSYCDFRGAILEEVSFEETLLLESIFDASQLQNLSLTKEQQEQIKVV